MNTNIPPQTSPAYEGGKPAPTGYQDGHQQTLSANEMQEKHPVAPGETFQGSQPQDAHGPGGFRAERDDARHDADVHPNTNAVEPEQRHIPPNQTIMDSNAENGSTGHDTKPAPTNYQQDEHGNQQQAPRANDLPEQQTIHPSTQGEPFQGDQGSHPAATGPRPGQDHVSAENDRNAIDAQQMPSDHDSHPGAMHQDQRHAADHARVGGPADNQGQPRNFAPDTGVGENRNAAAAKPAPTSFEQDEHGNQQQTPRAANLAEKQPIHSAPQGQPLQGDQGNHPAAIGPQPGQDHVSAGNARNSQQMPPDHDSHHGFMHRDQRHAAENARIGGPADNQRQPGNFAPGKGLGENRDAAATKPAPTSYQQDAHGNQQQAPYVAMMVERHLIHPPTQGQPLHGNQGNHPAAIGPRPDQDHVSAGNARNTQQMPPDHDSHRGFMHQDQRHAAENARFGGPTGDQGQHGNFVPDAGAGGNQNAAVAGSRMGGQHDHQTATTGTTGPSWRTGPVLTTVNQSLSGGPFSSGQQTSVDPTSSEARHLKTSGKMEEMVGKMFGSESLQRRGQEKIELGRNVAAQVQGTNDGGNLGANGPQLRGTDRGVGGGPTEQHPRGPPAQQDMGPGPQGGQPFRGH